MAAELAQWESDTKASVAEYNTWYLAYTADAYRISKATAAGFVDKTFTHTNNLKDLNPQALWMNPHIIKGLRMTSSPTWAVDRLIGISGATPGLVRNIEKNSTGKIKKQQALREFESIVATIKNGYDHELLPWLDRKKQPTKRELETAKLVMVDRLALSIANPRIKNEQEARQLRRLTNWLKCRKYQENKTSAYDKMAPGTYRSHPAAQGKTETGTKVTVQIDLAIMPLTADLGQLPILIECKSAGDFTNVNKRRKEESDKHANLVREHGRKVQYVLYLSGYFDANYLRYERDANIKWVWHHRINDLKDLGL